MLLSISLNFLFRRQVKIKSPSVPTECSGYKNNFEKNTFVAFDMSDKAKDASQTIVPFLDARPLNLSSPTPLHGMGIFYKSKYSCGGFITPKIITYDYSIHFN